MQEATGHEGEQDGRSSARLHILRGEVLLSVQFSFLLERGQQSQMCCGLFLLDPLEMFISGKKMLSLYPNFLIRNKYLGLLAML